MGARSHWALGWLRGRRAVPMPVLDAASLDEASSEERVRDAVLAQVQGCASKVAGRVDTLRSLSEREILACGETLSSIVESVRAMISEGAHAIAEARKRGDDLTRVFGDEMRKDNLTQQSLRDVLTLADGMDTALESIGKLTQHSNLLAINARIEAARIGQAGRGFAVIAEHMRDLSGTIREATDQVAAAVNAMRAALPQIEDLAESMDDRKVALQQIVEEQALSARAQEQASEAAHNRLDAVLRLSNEALSHLQFQDNLSQDLVGIVTAVDGTSQRVRRIFQGDLDVGAADESSATAHADIAGKVTLF